MDILRNHKFLTGLVSLIFALISWHFLSQNYSLGSFEARSMLTKRPVIIEWDRYREDQPFRLQNYVESDTFVNFTPASGIELVNEPFHKPSLYFKTSERIYPVFIRTRNSGLVSTIIGELSRLTVPEFSLVISMWLFGLSAFAIALLYIQSSSGLVLPFAVIACVFPQAFFFLYSQYPDTALVIVLIVLILLLLERGNSKKYYIAAGAAGSFALFVQLSAAIYAPPILLLYWDKIRKHFPWLFAGFLPFLAFVLITMNVGEIEVASQQRVSTKDLSFYFKAGKHFLLDISNPELWISYTIWDGAKSIESLLIENPSRSIIAFVGGWLSLILIALTFIERNKLLKLVIIALLHIIFIALIARGIDDDFYLYVATGGFLLLVMYFGLLRKPERKISSRIKCVLAIFFISRLMSLSVWHQNFNKSAVHLKDCVWVHSCMVKDWQKNNLIDGKPLITLYFLDVGQVEFFSQEKIVPIHFASRFTRDPNEKEISDFLRKFPYSEFRILASDPSSGNGKSISSYVRKEIIKSLGLKFEVIRRYDFPEFGKNYELLKVTRI